MERDSSFKKQLRKAIAARTEKNSKIKLLDVDIFENNNKKMI